MQQTSAHAALGPHKTEKRQHLSQFCQERLRELNMKTSTVFCLSVSALYWSKLLTCFYSFLPGNVDDALLPIYGATFLLFQHVRNSFFCGLL